MKLCLTVLLMCSTLVAAQDLTASQRTAAAARVRELADCVHARDREMQEILRLMAQAEEQARSTDARLRRDAEDTIEALIARAHDAQERTASCAQNELPSPGTTVVEREAPSDPNADHVGQDGSGLRTVEENVVLSGRVRVVRAEQVDGRGQLPSNVVRDAVHAIGSRIAACYEEYLDHGSMSAQEADLVFTIPPAGGTAQRVMIERSQISDSRFESCMRRAASGIRVPRAPSGGEATYSYTLRFGG